jgi:hypothetical protein
VSLLAEEWRSSWHHSDSVVPLTEGARGEGSRRGEVGVAMFRAGEYPACSRHGALTALNAEGIWRCTVRDCNVGAQTPWPWPVCGR